MLRVLLTNFDLLTKYLKWVGKGRGKIQRYSSINSCVNTDVRVKVEPCSTFAKALPIVDIKEGFWHTKICATFNRKLQKK